ncbi:MAG: hypothetical protein ACOYMB_04275 [Patescibacteria group bacterium]
MKKAFVSVMNPKMNGFLSILEKALEQLPNNPKPICEGFYLTEHDCTENITIIEEIGYVPKEKDSKYRHFSAKKVTQTLFFQKMRSKEFENEELEQYPGAVKYRNWCVGVSGHESMIDEAISTLWAIAKTVREGKWSEDFSIRDYGVIKEMAELFQLNYAPDNQWITIIVRLMENLCDKD